MTDSQDDAIRLIIFDLGGTVLDHGCQAPAVAVIEAFSSLGIQVTEPQARGPMGLHKRDHLRELLKLSEIERQWVEQTGRGWTEDDVHELYERFVPLQVEVAMRFDEVVPQLSACLSRLRERRVALAATTGYPRQVAQPLLDRALVHGFSVTTSVCADEAPAGRPAPWMLFRCMEAAGVFPGSAVAAVGDTVPDIQAARNAGVWAIGVTESSSEMGLRVEELEALDPAEREQRNQQVAEKLRAAGAHEVIRTLAELPEVVERVAHAVN